MTVQHSGFMYRYSTRNYGDMRSQSLREHYITSLGLDADHLVLAQQVHGNHVAVVTRCHQGKEIPDVDALVTNDLEVILGVRIADCVPILFADSKQHIFGVAHAGWKGTLAGIAINVIDAMHRLGSYPQHICVSIGPHIGPCCYTTPKERATKFTHLFHNPNVVSVKYKTWHVDLGSINYQQLKKGGVTSDHIEMSKDCTACHPDKFFSFRKDTKETFGEMMGVVAYGFTKD